MGVFLAAENAMNQLWGVPFSAGGRTRSSSRGRSLLLLLVLGGGALAATILAGLGTVGTHFGLVWKLGSLAALDGAQHRPVLGRLPRADRARRDAGGSCAAERSAAGVLYELLQTLGGYYVGHTLKHASDLYGTFGLVIGLLSWIYLSAHITLLAAEANVVATQAAVAAQLLGR